jgi:rod shape determining protein RodA
MPSILLPGPRRGLSDQLSRLHWPLIIMLAMIASAGVATLYSVGGGSWTPWAMNHATRFVIAVILMIVLGFIGIRYWMALAYPVYAFALIALMLVPFIGEVNMGARRWIDLGPMQFQPSEIMKVGLVMALARYYHSIRADQVSQIVYVIPPLLLIGAPAGLVAMQPDLDLTLMFGMTGVALMFLAGLSLQWALLGGVGALGAGWLAYYLELLHPYQLARIFTFLDPERDPLGAGYHLLQSKIGIGSGGFVGKGFMQGTQSELDFLPEMQTDFIFTIFCEEFGFVGAFGLLLLHFAVILTGVQIAMRARTHFARLATLGIIVTYALYVSINSAMVMGLAPVVGVPMPLVSYGGTAMLMTLVGFGLIMSAHISRETDSGL